MNRRLGPPSPQDAKRSDPRRSNGLRIVGGRFRGKRLEAPPDGAIRPTADRTRESLFNLLAHHPEWFPAAALLPDPDGDSDGMVESGLRGAVVLDAFGGTGVLSAEALSRGAAMATVFDRDPSAIALIRRNLRGLARPDGITVLQADACGPPPPRGVLRGNISLVLLDPPWRSGQAPAALAAIRTAGWLCPEALAVIEGDKRDPVPECDGFRCVDMRIYGRARLSFLKSIS